MSKEIFVSWLDGSGKLVNELVTDLPDELILQRFRRFFRTQHLRDVKLSSPGNIKVYESRDGIEITGGSMVGYFVDGAKRTGFGPGQSEETALFIKLQPPGNDYPVEGTRTGFESSLLDAGVPTDVCDKLCERYVLGEPKRKNSENDSTGEQVKKLQRVGEMITGKVPYPTSVYNLLSNYEGSGAGTRVLAFPVWNRSAYIEGAERGTTVIPLLMRNAYERLSQRLYEKVNDRAVVTGMPGIGKSWFVEVFASYLINDKRTAVILECDVGLAVAGRRRVEIIVPRDDGSVVDVWHTFTDEKGKEIEENMDKIGALIGDRPCWNLIDYRDKEKKTLFADEALVMKRVLFASPDKKRWNGFFVSNHDKGLEPTYIMPVWGMLELEDLRTLLALTEEVVKSDDLEHLVNLFGPSPRYCLSLFHQALASNSKDREFRDAEVIKEENEALEEFKRQQSEKVEATVAPAADPGSGPVEDLKGEASVAVEGSEEDEEGSQSGVAEQGSQTREVESGLKSKVFSSDVMLENALSQLSSEELRNVVKRAASIVKGRLMLPGVVRDLQHIIESPIGASCSSSVSTRLLVWGVPGHDEFLGTSDALPYARYASPYIAAVVLEENSKITLRAMAKFFESGNKNVGAGSGWMYEGFILKYWLPSLKQQQKFYLRVVGADEQQELEFPEGYACEAFGSLSDVRFEMGTMYLPVARNLGAVDCFMVLGSCLVAFQVTCGGDHSISKGQWDKLKKVASSKNVKEFWFVFIVPHWRLKNCADKAQHMKDKGKLLLVKGPYMKDNGDTLLYSIDLLKDKFEGGVTAAKLKGLLEKRKSQATSEVRAVLRSEFARLLRLEKGIQNSELEDWTTPRLLAHYEAKAESSDILQLVWPIQKSHCDGLFSAEK